VSANDDLLRFVLQHGEFVASVLRGVDEGADAEQARNAARDLEWLVKVNRRDWSHEEHTATCMSDRAEEIHRAIRMAEAVMATNHRRHMEHVRRIEAAFRAER
jgi:hypothetical protein